MEVVAAGLRELYQSLREAGFSSGQACQIVGTYLAVSTTNATGEETS